MFAAAAGAAVGAAEGGGGGGGGGDDAPDVSKYQRLLRLGMPEEHVRGKMKADGVDEGLVFNGGGGGGGGGGGSL